jgi:hypothetical protein
MDCIDRWLEKNTVMFSPVEARMMTMEVKVVEVPKELTEQEKWDKAMKEMGWLHLVGKNKEEEDKHRDEEENPYSCEYFTRDPRKRDLNTGCSNSCPGCIYGK